MLPPGQTDPELYQTLFREKCAVLLNRFSTLTHPEPEIFPSAPEAYRLRAEFRIWHQNGEIHYAMQNPGKEKTTRIIDRFLPGSPLIQILMPLLLEKLSLEDELKKQLFQVEFLTSLKGEAIITLIYHRPLESAWSELATALKNNLSQAVPNLHIVGRSRGQKVCLHQDFIYENFSVGGKTYCYQQKEGSFSQPNGGINGKMLEWTFENTRHHGGDLLELYCGNGNFTLPLSQHFNKVFATEMSKTAIQALLHNLTINRIDNISIARLSSDEAAQAIHRVRPFRRLAHMDLDSYQFSTLLVDPPRAGLDSQTLQLARAFSKICYISCNPETLIANLQALNPTHRIEKMAFFDQFPYTHHMECGVLLSQR